MVAFLVPIYVFMILFYQPLLMDFIHKVFGKRHRRKVGVIAVQIKTVIQRYLNGLLIEAVIVGVLGAAALLILGIEYAILLGILGAVLNVIPYIGGIVAAALPMMVALATKSPWFALYVLIIHIVIQIIDNNVIVPIIVASKVKINALFSVVVVIAGSAFWGLPGMFLSIPLLAIVKLVCDHIDPLKPWGFLLGDTLPPILKIKPILNRLKNRIKSGFLAHRRA
jgi:predicted PurR-regulated permease PerM